jgi:hypothetical protein
MKENSLLNIDLKEEKLSDDITLNEGKLSRQHEWQD